MTAPSAESPRPPGPGLRERKKIRTRRAIRDNAYRLFAEQGYDATPIDQIAENANVSPSTIFRYFPTKEDIVLHDGYDQALQAALRDRPAEEPPLTALRHALLQTLRDATEDEEREAAFRVQLSVRVPALRARMAESRSETCRVLATVLAERTGRDEDDLDLCIFTGAVMGAFVEALFHWGEHRQQDSIVAVAERTLDVLEKGLTPVPDHT
ncbi:TetR family transcriptional regulator [Streptomyces sp. NPDC005438]|uniref:TetR/AcrR family transcriptional regulator n=1 Tax=Streptomyces sp. NPDC005438 TaxID=3156880 RepID=UPI0033A506FC